ncbi:unnamed protein product [Microthlaspi erraticum]|uniref:Uncharacterized protein n=1 Tax=Microthlaspi erraticum TaxID=1685480 RepID=A0A6D2K7D4_9BRAS|nr:unnamed protein product [Microthlaspi erraticum]
MMKRNGIGRNWTGRDEKEWNETGITPRPPIPVSHPRPLSARGPYPCPTVGALFFRGSNDLFTIPAILTFPHVVSSLTRFQKSLPERSSSFNYSSPSMLNSGVTYGP